MASIKKTISLNQDNLDFATLQAKKMFGGKVSTYINYLISKDREKENRKKRKIL